MWRKLTGGFLVIFGYLLSPLSWWNDLFFNLPIAYAFGYLFSLISADLLIPCTMVGYWISNVAGILLMQIGATDILQKEPKKRTLKKELLTSLFTSTIYTVVIVLLLQLNILQNPIF